MGLEEKFDQHMGEWIDHCITVGYESNPQRYFRCTAYTSLVALGKEIFPHIHDRMSFFGYEDMLPAFCYTNLVRRIVGKDFVLPREIRGDDEKMKIYTYGWLSGYLSKGK